MSAYLKRLNIADVDDTGEIVGAYIKRVHIVEMVDSDGQPWEPVPGPDPFDELVVANKAEWRETNVYEVGSTIEGVAATYIGGTDQVTYRSRVQYKDATDTDWTNTPWTNHLNVPNVVQFTIPAGYENGQVRFQTQARDEGVDPIDQKNSFASIRDIAPAEWGAITQTIEGTPYDPDEDGAYGVAINSPIICAVNATGPDDITYEWSRRGSDPTLIGTPTAAQTAITFPSAGMFTVTVNIKSNKTAEWESAIFTFIAA